MSSANQPSKSEADVAIDFLLAEFEGLRDLRNQDESALYRRIDILVALVSALGAGLFIISQVSVNKQAILLISLVAVTGSLLIGLSTFLNVIRLDIIVTGYIRAINRIRRYFRDNFVNVALNSSGNKSHVISMPTDPTFPLYGRISGGRALVIVINGLLLSVLAIIIQIITENLTTLGVVSIAISAAVFLLAASLQTLIASVRFNVAEIRDIINDGQKELVEEGLTKREPLFRRVLRSLFYRKYSQYFDPGLR